ncbi:MAG: dTMP kinase [Bradymonadia bacterium]
MRIKALQRGKFIVLEGVDGAGTTTQANRLKSALNSRKLESVVTAQPSDGPIGRLIRSILRGQVTREDGQRVGGQAIAALFAADRSEHIESLIEPLLSKGVHVICDRYYHSSLAYQGLEVGTAYVSSLNEPMKTPDIVFFVDVDVDVALRRRDERALEDELYEVEAFQSRLREGYLAAFELRDADRMVKIDGNRTVDEVHQLIMEQVNALLS